MSLFSYAAVQGNIRARLSRLLDRPTWARLLEAGTVEEMSRLARHAPEGGISLQNLRGEVAGAASALIRFLPRGSRDLVIWYHRRFEIENLKTVLRAVHYHLPPSRPRASLIPLQSARWRWETLVEAASISAVVEQIRESPYARPLENAMERYRQEGRLFHLEIAVDLFYFQKLVKLIQAQGGNDKADARQFLGRWIAIQNLLWAYRYRIYGRMTPEEIINYTLHHAFGAGLDTVRRIALGSPVAVEAERLGFAISPGISELQALTEIEILGERDLFRQATTAISRPLSRLGGVLAYLRLLDAEVRDLTVIMEGKTIGLSGPEIARRMVRAA